MADKSTIEWTDATWNPVRGCSIVSKGCTNCYAMRQAHRFNKAGAAYEGLTKLTKGGPVWTGDVRLVRDLLEKPLDWRKPRRIFVNSMSDIFHEGVPELAIDQMFEVMINAHWHIFQVLTKRPQRMLEYFSRREWPRAVSIDKKPIGNVWLGVSVEDQATADERIPLLLQTPAAVRWISAEPLLERIDLRIIDESRFSYLERVDGKGPRIDWVVVGGESGPGARPMHPDWARSLRDQCAAASVPFFFKQWGAWAPFTYWDRETRHKLVRLGYTKHEQRRERTIGGPAENTEPFNVRRFGKKEAGRVLDGRTHDEYPA